MNDNENAIALLLPVQPHRISEGPVETIAATKLHTYLGAGKHFATWIKGRIAKYAFVEGVDFVKESRDPKLGSEWGGQNALEWHLTLDMAKELAMVQNNEKGREARRYFIDCERRLKAAAERAPRLGLLRQHHARRGGRPCRSGAACSAPPCRSPRVPSSRSRRACSPGPTCRCRPDLIASGRIRHSPGPIRPILGMPLERYLPPLCS